MVMVLTDSLFFWLRKNNSRVCDGASLYYSVMLIAAMLSV